MAAPALELLDRIGERGTLDRLLADVREGQSAVLVVRGEPGIGKSALLRYAAERASGFCLVQATGAEAEMELPFAGSISSARPRCSTGSTRWRNRSTTPWPSPWVLHPVTSRNGSSSASPCSG